jgi:hypothetical protein
MKKRIAVVLALVVLIGVLPGYAWAKGGRGGGGGHSARAGRVGSPAFRSGGHIARQPGVHPRAFRAGAVDRARFQPGHAVRGSHGFHGHRFRGHGHRFHGHGHRFHGHGHGGSRVFIGSSLFIGAPFWWGPPVWGPAYAAPPVIAYQTPPVYVPAPPPPTHWYYCSSAQGYYPYVEDCPGGWTPLTPTPPGG